MNIPPGFSGLGAGFGGSSDPHLRFCRTRVDRVFDVSDDALERAAPIIGGVASVETLNFATAILGNCACPV
jgi:hypothetical protein